MTHNLHILLGDYAEQNIYRIKEYIIKYGKEYRDEEGHVAADYLKFLLFADDGQLLEARAKAAPEGEFTSGIEDLYAVELQSCNLQVADNADNALRHFFTQLFSKTVNMQNRGDGSLHVCLHVPLFVEGAWNRAQQLMNAFKAARAKYTVDLLLFAPDIASLFVEEQVLVSRWDEIEEYSKSTLQQIVKAKTDRVYDNLLCNLILVENRNQSGVALNLTRETYTNIIGEYALTTAVYYNDIYTPAFQLATSDKRPIIGIGMSMIHFDRFYFVQYMLRKSYNYILEREGVNGLAVDSDKVSPIVQKVLRDNINILTAIYDNEVKPRMDGKKSIEEILASMGDVVKDKIKRLKAEFLSLVNEEEWTLPEKRVAMAQLLGEDDELLVGSQANLNQLVIDECRREVLDYFIDKNNRLVVMDEEAVDSEGNLMRDYAVLSRDGEPIETAAAKLKKIKQKKHQIKESTDYIRRSNKDLKMLGNNVVEERESHKRLTKDGFEFHGQRYYVMPKNIERPLEETFEPGTAKLPANVDLRQNFTRVKNQGELGSCTAFAMVSIYEYILKKNSKKEVDLSELFAYHSARKLNVENPEEEGTSLYDVVIGMGECGICLENLHPYRTVDENEPSKEAYDDAATRKITKALNVRGEVDDLKAAVAQGYPVAISLLIYDSFTTDTGFIHCPTEEERKGDGGGHAMVICGYSDENKVFIVRNSWGEGFGDKGYCYIPYSYIGDSSMLRGACIITEVSIAELKVSGHVEKVAISFNMSDAKVHSDILRTKIEAEEQCVKLFEEELAVLSRDYLELVTQLGRPQTREALIKGTEERLKIEEADLKRRKSELEEERSQQLNEYRDESKWLYIWSGIAAFGLFVIYTLLRLHTDHPGTLDYLSSWGWLNLLQVGGLLALFVATPHLIAKNKNLQISEERVNKLSSQIDLMWKIWFGILFVIVISYMFLALYKVIDPFPIGGLWQLILAVMSYIPFVSYLLFRKHIEREIKESYEEKILELSREIADCTKERNSLVMRFHITGKILDSLSELISYLFSKYKNLCSYVDNLREWYAENAAMEEMIPVNRDPFMSLTNNDCLDNFFKEHAEELTSELHLYELFYNENYDISNERIIEFKNVLKQTLQRTLWNYTEGFSIYDHVTQAQKFDYVDDRYLNIDGLLRKMDKNSEIFVGTNACFNDYEAQGAKCKLMFRESPGNNGFRDWDASVEANFGSRPTSHDLASPYKVFIIRLEGLSKEEVELLQ